MKFHDRDRRQIFGLEFQITYTVIINVRDILESGSGVIQVGPDQAGVDQIFQAGKYRFVERAENVEPVGETADPLVGFIEKNAIGEKG